MKLTVNSMESLLRAIGYIRELWNKHKYLTLNIKCGKDRSLDQNAVIHIWYAEIAMQLKEDDALGWKCFAKLHCGIPILRAEDIEFKTFYDGAIKGLTYEQKLSAIKFIPVTSIMTKPQLTKYAQAMQELFIERGVRLEFLEE